VQVHSQSLSRFFQKPVPARPDIFQLPGIWHAGGSMLHVLALHTRILIFGYLVNCILIWTSNPFSEAIFVLLQLRSISLRMPPYIAQVLSVLLKYGLLSSFLTRETTLDRYVKVYPYGLDHTKPRFLDFSWSKAASEG